MRGKLLVSSIIVLCLVTGCSMDSFAFLYDLTSSLKENVFTDVLGSDAGALIADIDDAISSIGPLEYSGGYALGTHVFVPGMEYESSIMPPLAWSILDSLSMASENRVKVEKVTAHLSSRADEDDAALVVSTYVMFDAVVKQLGDGHKAYDVLSRFVRTIDEENVTKRDVVALGTVMYVLSCALECFDEVHVDMDMVDQEFDMGMDEVGTSYIDSIALALGMGKSVARTIGSQWLFQALDGVLMFMRGAM